MNDIGTLDLKKLLKHAQIGVVIHRWDTSIVYANPTALRLLRLSYEQMIGKDALDPQWQFIDEAFRGLQPEQYPVNLVKQSPDRKVSNLTIGVMDGSNNDISWFLVNAYVEQDDNKNENAFIIVTFTDITENKSLFSFEDIVENAEDLVVVTEANDIESPTGPKIVYVNKAFEKLTGYSAEEVIGETPRILQGELTDRETRTRIYQALKAQKPTKETILNYTKKGHPYWLEMNIIPLTNKYGEVTHFAAIERDVSERRFYMNKLQQRNKELNDLRQDLEKKVKERTKEAHLAQTKLERMAFYDALTEIPNRRFVLQQAEKLLHIAQRHKEYLVVGIMDIDDFKRINDTKGHDAGDAVLKGVADCLTEFFRVEDSYGRLGGEEFIFISITKTVDQAESLLERLHAAIKHYAATEESILGVTISIGAIATRVENQDCINQLMKAADIELYKAKGSGKDCFRLRHLTED